jgi:hypothetical protein
MISCATDLRVQDGLDNSDATPLKRGVKPAKRRSGVFGPEQSSEFQLLLSPLLVRRLVLKESGL